MTTRRRGGVAVQLTVLTSVVATVAVLVAAVLTFGLVRQAAETEGRRTLGRQADLLAGSALGDRIATGRPVLKRTLIAQGIEIVRVTAAGRVQPADPVRDQVLAPYVARLAGGSRVSARVSTGSGHWLVEGRPVTAGSIVLIQPTTATRSFGRQVLARNLLALVVGLVVAVLAGVLLARRSSRSLRIVAAAAHRLAGGARDVRVPVGGPAEIAEVSGALNVLAASLQVSEGRQREFLLGVSHELRTPLTAISGFAESLRDGVVTGAEVGPTGETIHAEAARLERIVGDLLDLARLGAVDFPLHVIEVDLAGVLAAAEPVWRSRCAAVDVAFSVDSPPTALFVSTDPGRVRQILDGLAENALRVTPAGRPIVFALYAEPPWAVLEVRDGGPGLTPDDLEVAFDRMALYDRYRGVRKVGTGVGLALVAGLASRLGGRAEAGHAAEGGARFRILLPLPPPDGTHPTVPLPGRR